MLLLLVLLVLLLRRRKQAAGHRPRPLLLQGCHERRQLGWGRRRGCGGCLQQTPLLLQQGKVLLCQLLALLQGAG